jgi:hypothetical protein
VERLRQAEEWCQTLRADLLRAAGHWYGGVSEGPLKLSEAASAVLTGLPGGDPDRVKFIGSDRLTESLQRFFDRAMTDPLADFTEEPVTAESVAA